MVKVDVDFMFHTTLWIRMVYVADWVLVLVLVLALLHADPWPISDITIPILGVGHVF